MTYPMRKKSQKPVGQDGKTSGPMPDDYRKYVSEQVALALEFEGYGEAGIEAILSSPEYESALLWYWEDVTAVCLWEGTVILGRLREIGLRDPSFTAEGISPFETVPEKQA
ncbi:MAG: hypothetical protein ACYS8W_14580 [Planctomycetota bacterium]|jgi:hypothetical protein